ncbi:MAG TPA: kelch repeat-containing protein, partial [Flavobacteriales bacterium]|nr:kelch repeat-containing protein [Flavobacteriales bacterium]
MAQADVWTQMNDLGYHHPAGPKQGYNGDLAFAVGGAGYLYTSAPSHALWRYDHVADEWIAIAAPPVALASAKVFVLGQVAYFNLISIPAGWTSSVWAYDPSLDLWTQMAPFPGQLRSGFVAFSLGATGYIATGKVGTTYLNDLWSYDPVLDTWTQRASMNGGGRNGAFVFTINGIAYVGAGSVNNGGTLLTSMQAYDPVLNSWSTKAAPAQRDGAVGFSLDGSGYMGMGRTSSYTNDLRRYDPTTDLWSYSGAIGGLASGERGTNIVFVIGSKAYIGGGGMSSGGQQIRHNDLWAYNGGTGVFTERRTIGGSPRESHFAFVANSRGYVGCGANVGTELGLFWEFEPNSGQWTRKADASVAGAFRKVGTGVGNTGYAATGNGFLGSGSQGVRAYSPGANGWTSVSSLPTAASRTGAVGFTLMGRSYITTGVNGGSNYLNDLWAYDPVTDTWTQRTSCPGAARKDAVGFSIGNKGYMATGWAGSNIYNDVWEYDPVNDAWTQKASMPGLGRYR